jgi:N-acetylmuramoyl-L-alanine amidase
MRVLLSCFIFLCAVKSYSQDTSKLFIHLIQPFKENNSVKSAKQNIIGSTCKSCTITINQQTIKVYSTGAFVDALVLLPGDTTFTITAKGAHGIAYTKTIHYNYTLPKPADTVKILGIESIETFPEGDLLLQTGDKINFRVKALPNCKVMIWDNVLLNEMPANLAKGIPGIYQGEYVIDESDSFTAAKIPVTVIDKKGKKITKETKNNFSILTASDSDVAITKGRLAHLEYGLGDDRLGGAKIGYIDSLVQLKIIGKVGTHYKIRLTNNRTAYIPQNLVTLLPPGTPTPASLTDRIYVSGDDRFDYVKVGLFTRLPYQSFQLLDPSKIVVDIFGATNNTNWITQLQSAKEIKNISYEQIADGIFRITIELNHEQHWGHEIYYSGNNLVIKIKRQPDNLALKNITIAIDAGHGGTNNGAVGATGVYEKDITLAIALKLQKTLTAAGAKVIMTRTTEQFVDNLDRVTFYRDSTPDLLLSIHLNSSEDPLGVSGVSTYYRYPGFRNLSLDIYKRMLELGLKEYGNTGSFNFMLNSPTEYPNALVETVFLSNPDEEAKILDDGFQQKVADKIILGVRDFLDGCKSNGQ